MDTMLVYAFNVFVQLAHMPLIFIITVESQDALVLAPESLDRSLTFEGTVGQKNTNGPNGQMCQQAVKVRFSVTFFFCSKKVPTEENINLDS